MAFADVIQKVLQNVRDAFPKRTGYTANNAVYARIYGDGSFDIVIDTNIAPWILTPNFQNLYKEFLEVEIPAIITNTINFEYNQSELVENQEELTSNQNFQSLLGSGSDSTEV